MSEPTLNPKSGFSRFKVELSYDGSNYSGWAKQPNQRTIQGEVEAALAKIIGNEVETFVAGRTDAGVHASSQFLHFDAPEPQVEVENLAFKLNRILDSDIRIINCQVAPRDFHARFSARSRTYQYKIIDALKIVPPLERIDVVGWYRSLDETKMNEAAQSLIGRHDFRAFCKFREIQNTERTLMKFHWTRIGNLLSAEVEADSFCYSMVRNLVGASVCVGEGRFSPEWIKEVLAGKERVSDSYVFPPNGLTLIAVKY